MVDRELRVDLTAPAGMSSVPVASAKLTSVGLFPAPRLLAGFCSEPSLVVVVAVFTFSSPL